VYAACALECEGSITHSRSITKQGWPQHCLAISIANINRDFIQFFLDKFGGNIYSESPKKLSKRTIYRWKIFANQAIGFLKLVRPYMKFKDKQADLAFEFYEVKAGLTKDQKDGYWLRMKALNKGESPAETNRESVETNLRSDSPTLVETPVR
jgi:hypothetical protein